MWVIKKRDQWTTLTPLTWQIKYLVAPLNDDFRFSDNTKARMVANYCEKLSLILFPWFTESTVLHQENKENCTMHYVTKTCNTKKRKNKTIPRSIHGDV